MAINEFNIFTDFYTTILLNADSFSPAFHLYGWCEVVIHVLAITALMKLKIAAPRDFFVVSWVQSAHTCMSSQF